MADTDPIECTLLDADLFTALAILPADDTRLMLSINDPGSGALRIPAECQAAGQIASGQFIRVNYRGAARGGFFVDNISSSLEDGGGWTQVSGRGAMAILSEAVIWPSNANKTSRSWTSVTRGAILLQLISEAQTRGALPGLIVDFSATNDSAGELWTDSGNYELPVGKSVLDIVRDFSKFGAEFSVSLSGSGAFTFSAYQFPQGADKSETVYFRVGSNCQKLDNKSASAELKNAAIVKFTGGYSASADAASIAAHRRRETLYHADEARSGALARQWAAVHLDEYEQPRGEMAVSVYDGARPFAFADYEIGDTIRLDDIGNEADYRIRGMTLTWGAEYASVELDLNTQFVEHEIRVAQEVERLRELYATAHDANLLEASFWADLGGADNKISCIAQYGEKIVAGGTFDVIGGISAHKIAIYDPMTRAWTALGSGLSGSYGLSVPECTGVAVVGNSIYPVGGFAFAGGVESHGFARWDGATWSGIADFEHSYSALYQTICINASGTDLYIGGYFDKINGSPVSANIVKYDTLTATFSDLTTGANQMVRAISSIGADIFVGGDFLTAGGVSSPHTAIWNGTAWQAASLGGYSCYAFAPDGANMYAATGSIISGSHSGFVFLWNGASWKNLGTLSGTGESAYALAVDDAGMLYVSGWFTSAGGIDALNIAIYDGASFRPIGDGVNGQVYAVAASNGAVYIGGLFTSSGSAPMAHIAAYMTTFGAVAQAGNAGGSTARWGGITGTLSEQADLQSALDAKLSAVAHDATLTGNGTSASPLGALSSGGDTRLKVIATTGLIVKVLAGTYAGINNFYSIPDTNIDLTAYMPTVGNERWILVRFSAAGAIGISSGSELAIGTSTIANAPIPIAYRSPLALIKLVDGMTTITDAEILDARQINNSSTTAIRDSPIAVASFVDKNQLRFDSATGSWVAQAFAHDATLTGDGTTASPLAVASSGATLPASGVAGQVFLHTPTGRKILMTYSGTEWTPVQSLSACTMYVDGALGTDDPNYGYGTGAAAYKTINYALAQVAPFNIANANINVALGTYAETLDVSGKYFLGIHSLYIYGESTTLDSGTATSGTTGSGATYGTLTDTSKSWTINAYKGEFVTVNSTKYIIESNTATMLSLVGVAAIVPSGAYAIDTPGTYVDAANVSTPLVTIKKINFNGSNAISASVKFLTATFQICKFTGLAASARIFCQKANLNIIICSFGSSATSGSANIRLYHGGSITNMLRSYMPGSLTITGIIASYQSSAYLGGGNVMDGLATGISITSGYAYLGAPTTAGWNTVKNSTTALTAKNGGQIKNTASCTLAGNVTDKNAEAASYGYID